ncbi:DnaJ domain-containing protein, putative [Eimeria tenella]|uniref:DnaJ domain-containing protein, putative n=1 Tax=Eimeria tenella TaxID=5802 RepID=U6KNG4_EIMTE|nr:DnaJ domain-containing protein, putative [Eimeria tenella]CDJ38346.1 DnaJ domain-containing protein, putative [Eimeria tenella]|eukprot:XP_013229184.1 DnaJ domain-containing protein, putative [Eimeria tenella]
MERLLMLCDAAREGGQTVESLIALSICTITKKVEPAGRSFFDKYEKRTPSKHRRKQDASPTPPPEEDEEYNERTEKWRAKSKNKSPGGGGGGSSSSWASGTHLKRILAYNQTLYQILGVEDGASLDEIKKQYRKKVLEYHPDKAKSTATSPSGETTTATPTSAAAEGLPSSEHEAFLKVQEAYEALSDSNFRKQYDSSLPFDESIPDAAECEDGAKFYETFGAAFHRNARWSIRRPVPSLGNDSTPMREVERFYDFWFEFQSWRDFGVHDAHDLNDAECREERRWMERENAKIRKKYIKNERARIQKLVETAYSVDPRIQRQKKEQQKKKEEERAAKQRAIEEEKRAAEERKKREEEDAQRREEEARNLQKQQQQERQSLKKWRQKFRWFFRNLGDVEDLTEQLSTSQVQDLSMELGKEDLVFFFQRVHDLLQLEGPVQDEAGEPCGPAEISPSKEQRNLIFGFYIEKWRAYQDAKRSKEKAAEEEMRRVQEERRRQEIERKKAQQASWTVEELSLLAKALQKFPGGTARRWYHVATYIGTKTQDEVVQKAKEMSVSANLKTMGSKISQEVLEQSKHQHAPASSSAARNGTQAEAEPGHAASVCGDSVWTQEQQSALERALAKHPSSMPAVERWTAIANDVPGKTRKECVERFKQVRAAILASKST